MRIQQKLLLLTVLLVVAVGALQSLRGQNQGQAIAPPQTREESIRKRRGPPGGDVYKIAPDPADPERRAARQAKNLRYNRTYSDMRPLPELPPSRGGVSIQGEALAQSALPVAQSDLVVLGTIVGAQSYLTENRASIYSEFTVRVDEAFKTDSSTPLTPNALLTVDREGGALRMEDGRILRFQVNALGQLPRMGRQYVLFLKRVHENQDLTILTGYEVSNGRVFPLLLGGQYENTDLLQFLNDLRAEIARPQAEQQSAGGR